MEKKILFCTNSRSEMSTVLSMLSEAKEAEVFSSYLMVGGTHFSEKYGHTVDYIKRKGFEIDFCARYYSDDEGLPTALGNSIPVFCEALAQLDPDIVVITGDRIECLPLITACLLSNTLIAHVSGGDTTLGAIDNNIRHMITKASHVHFVAMEQHRNKLIQLGEHPKTIFVTGDPAIDEITRISKKEHFSTLGSLGLKFDGKYALCTFHPQTIDTKDNRLILENMLNALKMRPEFKLFTFPNGDPGSEKIIESLNKFVQEDSRSRIIQSFNGNDYYKVLAGATYIIGNSSSALWECPTLKIPAINLGSRQKGRARVGNVIDVSGHSLKEIEIALSKVCSIEFSNKLINVVNPYGNGGSSRHIVSLLKDLDFEKLSELKEKVG